LSCYRPPRSWRVGIGYDSRSQVRIRANDRAQCDSIPRRRSQSSVATMRIRPFRCRSSVSWNSSRVMPSRPDR